MKQNKKSLAAIVGASIVTSLSAGVVNAAENPFALKDLASGYTHLAEVVPYQAKPGEPAKPAEAPKPAEAAKPATEMKCGAEMMKKNPEMKCGASMMNMDAPATAAPVDKAVEKKCAGMKMEKPATPEAPKAH
jgi:uncharacterized low-complexity protein